MAGSIQWATSYRMSLILAILSYSYRVVATLPGSCHETIEVLDVPTFGRYWACSGVELYQGFNPAYYIAGSTQNDATACASFCLQAPTQWWLACGVWIPDTKSCECWSNSYPDPQPALGSGVTFIDFTPAAGHPPAAQNWGLFTCPEGANSGPFGSGRWCGPLNIEPAQPALGEFGITGLCPSDCSQFPGFQWLLTNAEGVCNCYGDLANVSVSLNFSSPWSVADYYDFAPHPTTSGTFLTSSTSTRSRSSTSSSTTSKSITKSTTGSTSKTTSKTTAKTSSSKLSSGTSSKTSSKTTAKTSSKSSSKLSSGTSSKTSLKTSSTTSKVSSASSLKHTQSTSSKTSSTTSSKSSSKVSSTTSSKTSSRATSSSQSSKFATVTSNKKSSSTMPPTTKSTASVTPSSKTSPKTN